MVSRQIFNGNIKNIGGTINYKVPPFLNVELGSQYNNLVFPSPYSSADFFSLTQKLISVFQRLIS